MEVIDKKQKQKQKTKKQNKTTQKQQASKNQNIVASSLSVMTALILLGIDLINPKQYYYNSLKWNLTFFFQQTIISCSKLFKF